MNGTESLSYWLIIKDERSRVEVLTVWLTGHGEALPVFSFEEEARILTSSKGRLLVKTETLGGRRRKERGTHLVDSGRACGWVAGQVDHARI